MQITFQVRREERLEGWMALGSSNTAPRPPSPVPLCPGAHGGQLVIRSCNLQRGRGILALALKRDKAQTHPGYRSASSWASGSSASPGARSDVHRGAVEEASTTSLLSLFQIVLMVNFSSRTTSMDIQRNLEANVEKRTKDTYGPPMGKRLLVFMDDMNMPKVRREGGLRCPSAVPLRVGRGGSQGAVSRRSSPSLGPASAL